MVSAIAIFLYLIVGALCLSIVAYKKDDYFDIRKIAIGLFWPISFLVAILKALAFKIAEAGRKAREEKQNE